MATIYTMKGFAPNAITGLTGNLNTAGSTMVLDPNWSASTSAYSFAVEDADWLVLEVSDTVFSGDTNNQEVGDDSYRQTLTLKNASGTTVASGRAYVEDVYTLTAPDGTVIHLYTVEVAGTFVGTIADGQMIPGVTYTVTSSGNTNGVSYSSIVDQTYDPNAANDLQGADTVADTFYGGAGADKVSGRAGNDVLYGGNDADIVVGGEGQDKVYGDAGNDYVSGDGQLYDLNFHKSGSNNTPTTLTVVNNATGPIVLCRIDSNGNSITVATVQEGQTYQVNTYVETNWVIRDENNYFLDLIDGAANQTYTYAAGHNDTVYGGDGDDTVMGQMGHDTVYGGAGNDTVYGGSGNDTLYADAGNDTVYGGDDRDTIFVNGADTVFGGEGGDDFDVLVMNDAGGTVTFTGAESGTFQQNGVTGTGSFTEIEYVAGGAGSDTFDLTNSGGYRDIYLQGGNDIFYGSALMDTAHGGDGNDVLYGGGGDDFLLFGAGDDLTYGGDGNDFIDDEYGVQLSGMNTVYGGAGQDHIYTGSGNDIVYGGADADEIHGESGSDILFGDEGDDTVWAEDGNDTLSGGAGNDTLYTGSGNDTIIVGSGRDVVGDFNIADDDLDGFSNDQLSVANLLNAQGQPISYHDVVVSDDGSGNAVLTFPNGEQIVLQGVSPTSVDTGPELFKIGIPCFTSGTMILTPRGEVPVEMLRPGDMVVTRDNGPQPLRWAGMRRLSRADLDDNPDLLPVKIEPGGWAGERGLLVSPQHAISTMTSQRGGTHQFVRARHLARLRGGKARVAKGIKSVTYCHLMFDQHQVVFGNSIASESFYPGPWGLSALTPESIREVVYLFPELQQKRVENAYGPSARPVARFRDLPDAIRDITLDRL